MNGIDGGVFPCGGDQRRLIDLACHLVLGEWLAVTMSGLEQAVARILARAGQKIFSNVMHRRHHQQLQDETRTLVPVRVAEGLVAGLDEKQAHRFASFLTSPDFEEIALQYVLGGMRDPDIPQELLTSIRAEIHHGLRRAVGLANEQLVTATDMVVDALTVASHEFILTATHQQSSALAATAAHIAAAAAENSRLLGNVNDLARVYEFAEQLRTQVIAVHGHMRLPHLGESKSVPYERLYVPPRLLPAVEGQEAPDLTRLAMPGQRSVILGHPGAGKSTLAAKLAHDVAADLVPGAEGRVPFLLVLRNFVGSFRGGGEALAHYLEQVCGEPYNLKPPPDAIEYLLRNGRAVVLLDGLDELVESELRRRFTQLVEGFISRYPLVPLLVTARRIGYFDAPLDHRTVAIGIVAELSNEQVRQYAERWFNLDTSTALADRVGMAASFLEESKSIAELRANPLLLALLCAMYSSEHYIPANLTQIYERCAVMLFDRWDFMRGIAKAPQFFGRLRSAVQHLAWLLFTADASGKALPRYRIVGLLAEHLIAKGFNDDEAVETAEQFVEFCTGRSWILSDVGATETEPLYGFTHRTFMEYFAAEHLTRTHPTAERLWAALRPHVLGGEWDVVAQIALQLLDRHVDGGADILLRMVLAETHDTAAVRARLHGFAAAALGYVHPGHDVVREVTAAAVRDTLDVHIDYRYHYWSSPDIYGRMSEWDQALGTCMYNCSPGNLSAVRRAVSSILEDEIESGSDTANFVLLHLDRHPVGANGRVVQAWQETQLALREQTNDRHTTWCHHNPWASICAGTEPDRLVATFGAGCLYLSDDFLFGSLPSVASRLLFPRTTLDRQLDHMRLRSALITARRPWISSHDWWAEFSAWKTEQQSGYLNLIDSLDWQRVPLETAILLLLPYLETLTRLSVGPAIPNKVFAELATSRRASMTSSELKSSLRSSDITRHTRVFLLSWTRNEFNLVDTFGRDTVFDRR